MEPRVRGDFCGPLCRQNACCEREAYSDRGADECHPSTKHSGHSILSVDKHNDPVSQQTELVYFDIQLKLSQLKFVKCLSFTCTGHSSGIYDTRAV